MTDITITRWAKYGHERGYATAPDGTKLGWIDVKTGAIKLELEAVSGDDAGAVAAALVAWASGSAASSGEPPSQPAPGAMPAHTDAQAAPALTPDLPEPAPAPQAPASEPEWHDLATHRPGQLVREQAAAEWEAAKQARPIMSRLARALNVHTDERAWRVGAEGEEAVGARLEKLRDHGWHVLHSVPVGTNDSDIDHVLIGPGGVFTLNTKNHPGGKIWVAKYQMRVNGQVVPYLRNASHEASRASKLLTRAAGFPVSVRSCVVVLTGTIVPDVTIRQMPDDVMVLDRMDVPRWFKKRPAALTSEQVDAIYDVARRSGTWV